MSTRDPGDGVPQIGEGRDARTEAALFLAFRDGQRLAQLPERRATEHGAEEQAVGFQDAGDLDQGPGQIVHPVKRHGAEHEIELPRGEGQSRPREGPAGSRGRDASRRPVEGVTWT